MTDAPAPAPTLDAQTLDAPTLDAWRVLVPRSGPWGDRASALLRARGATPVVADLIAVAAPHDPTPLADALARLAAGAYDWVMVTSAATASVLEEPRVALPDGTRIAAIGEATAEALARCGFAVDFTAPHDPSLPSSAVGLAEHWHAAHGSHAPARILVPQSDLAPGTLADTLRAHGHAVETVAAYSTVARALPATLVADARSGRLDAVLVTSGSVARSLAASAAPLHPSVVVAAIGPVTAAEARAAGLRVDVVAPERSLAWLVRALADFGSLLQQRARVEHGAPAAIGPA